MKTRRQDNEIYQKMAGRVLGKCKIREFEKKEDWAVIFKGRQEELALEASIKLLLPSPGVDHFLARAKKIMSLEHPKIAKIYDVGFVEEVNQYYFAEEWVRSSSFGDILESEGPLSLEDAIHLVLETAKILVYAHNQGVPHSCLIPRCIAHGGAQDIKLTSFGFAPGHQRKGIAKPILGPKGYLAPEQLQGAAPSMATDIYNLGATFIHLLSGQLPFPEQKNLDTVADTPPEIKMPEEVPDNVAALIRKMLAPEPEQRFTKAGDLVGPLEELYLCYHKIRCPRCGKKNIDKEVFHCKQCNTKNLCLTHLVAQDQCCDRCVSIAQGQVTQKVVKPSALNRLKLSDFLCHLANSKKIGLLVMGSRVATLGLNITGQDLEICLEKTTVERVQQQFYSGKQPAAGDIPKIHEKVARHYLTQMLDWKEFSFEFWENAVVEKVIPQHKTKIAFAAGSADKFLRCFAYVLRIVQEARSVGGITLDSGSMTAGVLFTDKGVVFMHPAPLARTGSMLSDVKLIEPILSELTVARSRLKIQYRTPASFPETGLLTIPSPVSEMVHTLSSNSWDLFDGIIAKLDTLLPMTTNWDQPFGGMDLSKIVATVTEKLLATIDFQMFHNMFGVSPFQSSVLALALIKEKLGDTGKTLLELFEGYRDRWSNETAEIVLQQAYQLCPDAADLCNSLGSIYTGRREPKKAAQYFTQAGNLHWEAKDFGLALPAYEKASQMDQQALVPKLRLLELYERLEHKEKARNVGIALFNALKPQARHELAAFEKVCLFLVKFDPSFLPGRKELIKVYLGKNDRKSVIAQYEALLETFQQTHNRDGYAKAMATIVSLDNKRTDLVEKLKKMGYDNWKPLVEKLPKYTPTGRFKLPKPSPKLLGIAAGTVIVLLLTGIGFILFRSRPATLITPVVSETPAQKQLRELQSRWADTREAIARYKRQENWQKVIGLCQGAMEEFGKTSLAQEAKAFAQNTIADVEKIQEQNLAVLWQQLLNFQGQKKFAEAKDVCQKIIAQGNAAWQIKAQNALRMIQAASASADFQQREQQRLYDDAVVYQKAGKLQQALATYEQIEILDPKSNLALSAQEASKWITGIEQRAQKLLAQGESLERAQKYLEALDAYQEILADSHMKNSKAAQRVVFPLVIETEPAGATCVVDRQSLGETPLVYHYAPSQKPQVTVIRRGFAEESRTAATTKSEIVWKITIALKYEPLWVFETKGPVEGPLAWDDDTIYVGSRNSQVYAVTPQGKEKWKFQAGALADISGGVVVYKNNVYFGTHRGDLVALDKNTGRQVGKFAAAVPIKCLPCIHDAYAVFTTENGNVWFVGLADYKLAWQYSLGEKCETSPWDWQGKAVFVGGHQKLYAISLSKKKALWQQPKGRLCAGPLLFNNRLYCTTNSSQALKLDLNGKELWKTAIAGSPTEALLATDAYVFVGDHSGNLYCLDNQNGALLWQQDTAGKLNAGAVTSALLYSNNVVFVGNTSKRIVALDCRQGKVLWEYDSEDNFVSRPVLAQNTLFIASEKGRLYAMWVGDFLKK